jgi:recombinational DNA repair protein RecT
MNSNVPATAARTMELINSKPANEIPMLEEVKNKYVQIYNSCNPGENGEFMFNRNLVHLQQILNSTAAFKACTPFSVYACMTTIAAYGYSCDPADDHVYFVPREGRLCISKQAGAKLLRLYKSKQIVYNGEPTLIYDGDIFTKKDGIIYHEECYKSDKIIGGYVKFTLDKAGTQRHISYKLSDIEGWRLKSPQSTGPNWRFADTGQPHPGFLRTKIMAHACTERCWIPGNAPMGVDIATDVIIDANSEDYEITNAEPHEVKMQRIVDEAKKEDADYEEELRVEAQYGPISNTAAQQDPQAPKPAVAPSFLKKKTEPAIAEDKPF